MYRFGCVVLVLVSACGGDDSSSHGDGGPGSGSDGSVTPTLSVSATYEWIYGGGGGEILAGGPGSTSTEGLLGDVTTHGWTAWKDTGEVVTWADVEISVATFKYESGEATLEWLDTAGKLSSVGLPTSFFTDESNDVFGLDTVRSLGGYDNFTNAFGSVGGVPSIASAASMNPTIHAVPGLTSDRFGIPRYTCQAGYVLTPLRSDAGFARVIQSDGTTIFTGTVAGAASCKGDRLVMDGKMYSLGASQTRTLLATLTTDEIDSVGWTADGKAAIVANGTARLFDRTGAQTAMESGVFGEIVPELPIVNQFGNDSFAFVDEHAMRFDPTISNTGNTGEFRVTGHANGDGDIAIGDAIVSVGADSSIVQDKATGKWTDDRDTTFGATSVSVSADKVAIATRLVNTSITTAKIVAGKLQLLPSRDLPTATSAAVVAVAGDRIAFAYHVGGKIHVEVRLFDGTGPTELTYDIEAAENVAPVLAWDTEGLTLAMGTGSKVSVWAVGQAAPGPSLDTSVTHLAWSKDHQLAIGSGGAVGIFSASLETTGIAFPFGSDFAYSPGGYLAMIDGDKLVFAHGSATSAARELTIPAVPGQLPQPLKPVRVRWVDDSHVVVMTDHGFIARYVLGVVE